jgi:hypothetical protein
MTEEWQFADCRQTAAVDFAVFTARLEAAPFSKRSALGRVSKATSGLGNAQALGHLVVEKSAAG